MEIAHSRIHYVEKGIQNFFKWQKLPETLMKFCTHSYRNSSKMGVGDCQRNERIGQQIIINNN